jgi:glycosyltransferase involved in cell wall biosynthesis
MRILYIRGINQVAKIYASDLRQRGHSVTLHEPSLTGNLAPLPIRLAMMPGRVLDLRHIVGQLSPRYFDLVHIHWASYGVLGFLSEIPFIVECHGSDVRYRLQHPFFRTMLASVFRRARAVLCITPDLLPVVQSVYPGAIFFPGPVDTDQFRPMEDKQNHLSRPWTILLFTRLDAIKGPEIATQGIALFTERHPDVCVRLLDWGSLKEQYKRLYGQRFEFIPCVPSTEAQRLLWSADVVVGQFNLGILSFAELQAMSCAKPLICSFHYEGAYPTVPPVCRANTAEEVDAHLENLFQHPEVAAAQGQNEREWVMKNHDHRTLSVRLETLYKSIVEVPR